MDNAPSLRQHMIMNTPIPSLPPDNTTSLSVSRGLPDWLIRHGLSFAFTSYQTGQLFLVGVQDDGAVLFNQQSFVRAMGVYYQPGRLYLGGLHQIWRLENVLRTGERANGSSDALFVPRNAQSIGDIDIHEVAPDANGRVTFVNTKYSCLATVDVRHSFRPIWQPGFISQLLPEDRCHLNGMAMHDGKVRYVTAVSRSDIVTGWRERREAGGVLIECDTQRIVTDELSMPHSPRVNGDQVFVLDSGRGWIVRVDPTTGARDDVAFCPGFLRGMALHDGYALVTVSKPRRENFAGLALDTALQNRDAEPWCGVLIVNLATGGIEEWVKLDGTISELFDVAAIPGIRCPIAIGPEAPEMRSLITF